MDLDLTLRLFPERGDTSLAEITELPGALAPGNRATDSSIRALALALRIVADRLDNGELGDAFGLDGKITVRVSLDVAARMHLQQDTMRNALDETVSASVSPEVEQQIHDHLLEPPSALNVVHRAIVDQLGGFGQEWRPARAPVVLQALERIGWQRKRANPHFQVLARLNSPDVCFPFDGTYTIRPVTLERLAAATGLRPEHVSQ